jgi:hypothetical protein
MLARGKSPDALSTMAEKPFPYPVISICAAVQAGKGCVDLDIECFDGFRGH